MNKLNPQSLSDKDSFDDDIDLRNLFKFFFRNKYFIFIISFIAVLISHIYSKTITRVWEGEFQIVLDNKQNTSRQSYIDNSGLGIGSILGSLGQSQSSSLQTQVGILESPSVLKPVFEFVNLEKKRKDPSNQMKSFSIWKTSFLDVELKKQTSILNISYRDNDKSIIIPVLKKISNTYQDYSGINKKRSFQITNEYLTNQIAFYKNKSSNSIKNAQQFAIEQDLSLLNNFSLDDSYSKSNIPIDQLLNKSRTNTSNSFLRNTEIENLRVSASNRIRKIDKQIEKINSINDNYDRVPYLKLLLADVKSAGFTQKIDQIDFKLTDLKAKYTDKEESIKKLENFRNLLLKEQKIGLINFLKAQRIEAEAQRDAATRPKGVILKYKELLREADRDENTLVALENELRINSLNEAKYEDPWKLITEPTLKDYPVKPDAFFIRLVGLALGIISGTIIATYREKKNDLIYNEEEIAKILNTKKVLKFIPGDSVSNDNELLIEFLKFNNDQKYQFYSLNSNSLLANQLNEFLKDYKIEAVFNEKLLSLNNNKIIILVEHPLGITYRNMNNIKNILSLKGLDILGIITLGGEKKSYLF